MKQERGITLIALVITIIVLLILAGVSIAMLTGENGLLSRSKNAVIESKIADCKESVMLTVNELVSEFYEKKYVKNETLAESTPETYVAAHIGDEGKLDKKYATATSATSTDDATITLVEKDPAGNSITGTYSKTDGTITWNYPTANQGS